MNRAHASPSKSQMAASFEPTLVIGDVHHEVERAERLISKYRSRAERIVLLGDYFDQFGDDTRTMKATCCWLMQSLGDPSRIHLLGNHDLAYVNPANRLLRCPGWNVEKQKVFDRNCAKLPHEKLGLAVAVGPWLLSHAGFTPHFATRRSAAELLVAAETALAAAMNGVETPLLAWGRGRGGPDPVGGITWADWRREFTPIVGLNQIVGHTPCRGLIRGKHLTRAGEHRWTEIYAHSPGAIVGARVERMTDWISVNWCVDCGLHAALLISPDGFEVLPGDDA